MVQCLENKTDDELNILIRNKNVINYIKARKLSWFGHVERMANNWTVIKIYDWKTIPTGLYIVTPCMLSSYSIITPTTAQNAHP